MTSSQIDPITLRLTSNAILNCDILIIGTGPGGAAVAQTAVKAGRNVLMLEEGPFRPAERAPEHTTDAFLDAWRGAGLTPAIGKPLLAYAEGRCVGGGSEINSAIFQRASDAVITEWRNAFRIRDMTPSTLKPYYDRAANAVNASITEGPLGAPSNILLKAGNSLGWKVSPLERGQINCVGTNLCSFVCPTSGKQSMSNTLLREARKNSAKIVAQARVEKLIFKGKRATGAVGTARLADDSIVPFKVHANTVFVCCGAIQTPALLLRSGRSGPIGTNLRLHPTVKVQALFNEEINGTNHRLPLYAITEFMPDIRLGGSITRPGLHAMSIAEDFENRMELLDLESQTGNYYAMIRARGIGKVRPTIFGREPIVRYTLTNGDWNMLTSGLRYLAKAMFAAGALKVFPSLRGHLGWNKLQDAENDLERPISRKKTNLMTIHLFSSCPLGEDIGRCPVNSYGALRNAQNVFVADSSLIPTAPGVNPQGSVMALAYRCADYAFYNNH